jgi:hypothetical protein
MGTEISFLFSQAFQAIALPGKFQRDRETCKDLIVPDWHATETLERKRPPGWRGTLV